MVFAIAALLSESSVNGIRLGNAADVNVMKLDETTRRSVQRAAAAALSVAVAAKKAAEKDTTVDGAGVAGAGCAYAAFVAVLCVVTRAG